MNKAITRNIRTVASEPATDRDFKSRHAQKDRLVSLLRNQISNKRPVISYHALRKIFSHQNIKTFTKNSLLIRVARGWYTLPHLLTPAIVKVIGQGATITGPSALAPFNVWLPRKDLTIRSRSKRNPIRITIHTRNFHLPPGETHPVSPFDDPETALLATIWSAPLDEAAIITDSVIYKQVLTPEIVDTILEKAGSRGARVRKVLTKKSESGTESIFALWLRKYRIPFEQQVNIPGIGRVDFLINGWLIAEIDSQEHHRTLEAYHTDRRRDLLGLEQGFITLRLTYEMVRHELDELAPRLVSIINRQTPTKIRQRSRLTSVRRNLCG